VPVASQQAVLVVSLLCVVGCGKARVESRKPFISASQQVYAAVFDSLYKQPESDTVLIAASTIKFRVPTNARATWQQQFDSIPPDLARQLEVASQNQQPSTALALPRPIRVLSGSEILEIFKSGTGEGWTEFYRRYPRQRKSLRLTPVVFTSDSLDALVYYEYYCGSLCAGGDAVWLKRDKTQRWKIRKVVGFWVS
jgi:hypothetical protein